MGNIKQEKGFTLFEAVVAIGILLVGVVGLYMSVQNLKKNFEHTSKYVVAAYLNQEALEIIRNKRDGISSGIVVTDKEDDWWSVDSEFGSGMMEAYYIVTGSEGPSSFPTMEKIIDGSPEKCFSNDINNLKECFYGFSNGDQISPITIVGNMYVSRSGGDPTPFKRIVRLQKIPKDGSSDENKYDRLFVESITLFVHSGQVVRHRARMNLYGCYYAGNNQCSTLED